MADQEVWYRYEGVEVFSLHVGEAFETPRVPLPTELRCDEYVVVKETPKGVWVVSKHSWSFHDTALKRFVLRGARKRFAHPTKSAALESFIARKKSQLKILAAQKQRAEETRDIALRMLAEMRSAAAEDRNLGEEREYGHKAL